MQKPHRIRVKNTKRKETEREPSYVHKESSTTSGGDKINFSSLNWISTVIAILLGFLSLVGWIKESGSKDAIMTSIAVQTQKQWDATKHLEDRITQLEINEKATQTHVEWLKEMKGKR